MKIFKVLPLGLALGIFSICYADTDTFNSSTDQAFESDNSQQEVYKENYTYQLNKLIDAIQNPNSLFGKSLSENQMNKFVKLTQTKLSFENIKEMVKELLDVKKDLLEKIPEVLSPQNIEIATNTISNFKETLINQINNVAEEATKIVTECKEPLIKIINNVTEDNIYKVIEDCINIIIDELSYHPDLDLCKLSKNIASFIELLPMIKPEKYLKDAEDIVKFSFILLGRTQTKFFEELEKAIKEKSRTKIYEKKATEINLLSLRLLKITYILIFDILLDDF